MIYVLFGSPVTKQTLSKWIFEAISLAVPLANLHQWLSELTQLGVWWLLKLCCQAYPFKMFVMWQASPSAVLSICTIL